ncbi:hypothetical protein [Streptomyces sp. ME19-01-6]|uniref:hypothetical protein n=1 Tax=Streptomyces sp. ME19-01-6 TaxID=3028686 RepID=UPI0029ACEBEB|nr:hypothetical protein [Streptomyces sp. ME19-01-6]MDX3226203.1 hypothetical protein [Streptomyces sp. ME19-01-6]
MSAVGEPEKRAGRRDAEPCRPPGRQSGAGSEAGREAAREAELRALLERGVPRLPAPAQRMRRVQQLVARRRRRRVAGMAGAAGVAGGVAAAVTLAVLGQAPAAGPRGPGATYQVPAASPTATHPVVRYPGLDGLTVRLPRGWSGRGVRGGEGAGTVGLAGNRPAAVDTDRCTAGIRHYCLAPHELRRGEGLLILRLGSEKALGATDQRARMVDTRPGKSCRLAGGTRELLGRRAVAGSSGASGPHELITASVCLNRPSAGTLEQVRSILGSAVFGGNAAQDAGPTQDPGPTRDPRRTPTPRPPSDRRPTPDAPPSEAASTSPR